jgi:hypothetical protein
LCALAFCVHGQKNQSRKDQQASRSMKDLRHTILSRRLYEAAKENPETDRYNDSISARPGPYRIMRRTNPNILVVLGGTALQISEEL